MRDGLVKGGGELTKVCANVRCLGGHPTQIASEAEVLSDPRQHNGTRHGLTEKGRYRREQISRHLQVERVRALGPVQSDDSDCTLSAHFHGLGSHMVHLK